MTIINPFNELDAQSEASSFAQCTTEECSGYERWLDELAYLAKQADYERWLSEQAYLAEAE